MWYCVELIIKRKTIKIHGGKVMEAIQKRTGHFAVKNYVPQILDSSFFLSLRQMFLLFFSVGALLLSGTVRAQETVCAKVKIEIKQELTLERQAFDAQMKINNTTTNGVIENVSVVVKITEENGTPVLITDDPTNLSAKFFVRVSNKENIDNVSGTGTVNPSTTSAVNWLIIPAPGSAGSNPLGKKYLVGATLKYRFGGDDQVLEVSPDVITVKPLPLLTLDYFLTQNVLADDPLTPEIEATEPFTLGVRVKNNGFATAKGLKIDSAQPKIIENSQGLLINFKLTGSYINDAPAQNTLLIDFGDIEANQSKMGRWLMETTLAGKFTEFTARFSHADELGGLLTSIMQATNAHFLIHDVRVDLPGRDYVRDFLAQDGDVIRVYESDAPDTVVTDRSTSAQLTATVGNSGNAAYQLTMPATAGFVYVKLPDPFNGQKALGQIVRSDAKVMLPENVWLSKTRNEQTKKWEYWVNFFDINTTGMYNTEFQAPPAAARAPQIQFVPDHVVKEGKQVAFVVEASSPDGKAVTVSAAPLPAGATFVVQSVQAGVNTSIFNWTPSKGQAGNYLVTYTVTDGSLSTARSASIKVETDTPPVGPTVPVVLSPLADTHVPKFKPTLTVQTNAQETTSKLQFEIYADSAMTQLVDSALIDKGTVTDNVVTTSFTVTKDLNDNTRYWWRVRAYDGTQLYSAWANSKLFVNIANDPPNSFNLTSPVQAAEVVTVIPVLSWTNSVDRDEDSITYSVYIYKDVSLNEIFASAVDIAPGISGSTSWTVDKPLANNVQYYWRVVAADMHGATTLTPARPFTVKTGNAAPTPPTLQFPANGSQVANSTAVLTIVNSTDVDGDLITYVFEIDSINTFDSGQKKASGQVIQGAGNTTSWTVNNLVENKHYYWRVKAQDAHSESEWVTGAFMLNAVNDPPAAPTIKNPGNGSWSGTQQPSLEANITTDPEGESVQYQFEVYRDAALKQKITDGVSSNNAWIVPVSLVDKTTHYWRVRASDPQGATSGWSLPAALYISTGPYVDPTISVTAPATIQSPSSLGGRKLVTIRWEGTDPNIEPTVALYYSTSQAGYTGNLIVDGLKQSSGTQTGSYIWDVTDIAPGTYYVYATIYDAKGVGRNYASGAVVIAPASQSGTIVIGSSSTPLTVTANGGKNVFTVRLGNAPTSSVVVPISSSNQRFGYVAPASLTFTPQNWQTPQTVSITGAGNCAPEGNKNYQVQVGRAVSLDPQYIDVQSTPVAVITIDSIGTVATSNNANIYFCNYRVISETQINATTWEYVMTADVTNTGLDVGGLTATLTRRPSGTTLVEGEIIYGAVNKGNTINTTDTFVFRARTQMPASNLQLGAGFYWTVSTR